MYLPSHLIKIKFLDAPESVDVMDDAKPFNQRYTYWLVKTKIKTKHISSFSYAIVGAHLFILF